MQYLITIIITFKLIDYMSVIIIISDYALLVITIISSDM